MIIVSLENQKILNFLVAFVNFMQKSRIKLVIFDNDDTLIEVEPLYSQLHKTVLGSEIDWSLRTQLMGKTLPEAYEIIKKSLNIDTSIEELIKKHKKCEENMWSSAKLMPGAESLVKRLKEKNIKMCIATSSYRDSFTEKSKYHKEFYDLFDYVVTGDDVVNGKPSPEIFLKCLDQFEGIKPEECLVFEDSAHGITAANRAKMLSVFIPNQGIDHKKWLEQTGAEPSIILKSMEDFDINSSLF